MIGSSNLSRNFFQSGSRGRGVRRLAPKRWRLSGTAAGSRPVSAGSAALRTSRMVRMGCPGNAFSRELLRALSLTREAR